MLKIICGEWGTGKSLLMYDRIRELAEAGERVVLFVPDQFSFQAEKIVYKKVPHRFSGNVTVTMFSRMSQKILHLYGEQKEYADEMVKSMLMLRALRETAESGALVFYGSQYKKQGFPAFALRVIGELKNAGLSPSALRKLILSENEFSELLTKKLSDICEIYSAYDRLLTLNFDDRLDDVRRASEIIRETDIFDGCCCFFDSFDNFSGSQLNFIKSLLLKAKEVTFTLTADSPDSGKNCFMETTRLIGRLKDMAEGEAEITTLTEKYRNKSVVCVTEARDIWQECDFICGKIRELIGRGERFRDIAVLVPEAKYGKILKSSMEKYEIPCFIDIPEPIISKSFVRFALYTLRALSFETEDILRYSKSGFVRHENGKVISDIQADRLERFVRKYDIRKRDWKKEFPKELKEYEELEALRKSIILPLTELRKSMENTDGDVMTKELCDFLCNKMDISSTIYGKCLSRNKPGEPKSVDMMKMDAYSSLWDDVVTVFESAYRSLSGYRLTIEEYIDILTSVFSSVTVSSPPQVLDAVTVGDTERSRFAKAEIVFLCGFNEGLMPPPSHVSDAFTSSENETLARHGISISYDRLSRYSEELFTLYRCLDIPERELHITYPLLSGSFQYLEPSSYLKEVTEKYGISVRSAESYGAEFYCRTEKSAERYLASIYSDYRKLSEKEAIIKAVDKKYTEMLENAAGNRPNRDRHRLEKEHAEKLLSLKTYSPTAITLMGSCKFGFFCKYGLGLREEEARSVDILLVGNVIHYCLYRLLSDYLGKKEEFIALDKNAVRKHVNESIELYKEENYPKDFGGSERFSYLLGRIGNFAVKAAEKIQDEIADSGFYPEALEKELEFDFGDIKIRGICDRIDTMVKDGKKYIRVVDYKRGKRAFDLKDIYNGENLQMLLYLFGLCEEGGDLPSSVMYTPVGKESFTKQGGGSFEAAKEKSIKSYIRSHSPSGLLVESSPEKEELQKEEAKLTEAYGKVRDGYISVTGISDEAFSSLKKYCRSYVNAKVKEALSGMAGACPRKSDSCEYCEYGLFCGIEEVE